jgi:hypothetical protein
LVIREKRFRRPSFPSVMAVKIILAAAGPKIMIGNIRIPSIFGTGSRLIILGATTIKAPNHDIVKVITK